MNLIKTIKYLTIFICVLNFSCVKEDNTDLKHRIAKKTVEYIIENDSLKTYKYSSELYVHILADKLNANHFKTFVSLRGLQPQNEFESDTINVDGFKTIIYNTSKLNSNFFVPDAKFYSFLIEYYNDEITLSRIYRVQNKNMSEEELNKLDF